MASELDSGCEPQKLEQHELSIYFQIDAYYLATNNKQLPSVTNAAYNALSSFLGATPFNGTKPDNYLDYQDNSENEQKDSEVSMRPEHRLGENYIPYTFPNIQDLNQPQAQKLKEILHKCGDLSWQISQHGINIEKLVSKLIKDKVPIDNRNLFSAINSDILDSINLLRDMDERAEIYEELGIDEMTEEMNTHYLNLRIRRSKIRTEIGNKIKVNLMNSSGKGLWEWIPNIMEKLNPYFPLKYDLDDKFPVDSPELWQQEKIKDSSTNPDISFIKYDGALPFLDNFPAYFLRCSAFETYVFPEEATILEEILYDLLELRNNILQSNVQQARNFFN